MFLRLSKNVLLQHYILRSIKQTQSQGKKCGMYLLETLMMYNVKIYMYIHRLVYNTKDNTNKWEHSTINRWPVYMQQLENHKRQQNHKLKSPALAIPAPVFSSH